jgi:hypothetical protein
MMKRREQCSLGRADLFHGTAPERVAFVHFLIGFMVDFLSDWTVRDCAVASRAKVRSFAPVRTEHSKNRKRNTSS